LVLVSQKAPVMLTPHVNKYPLNYVSLICTEMTRICAHLNAGFITYDAFDARCMSALSDIQIHTRVLSNCAQDGFLAAEMCAPNCGLGGYPAIVMAARSAVLSITRDYKNEFDVQVTVHRDIVTFRWPCIVI